MSKASLETALRQDVLQTICEAIEAKYGTDVLQTGSSEFAIPLLDAEGNEKFVKVTCSVKRGTLNGAGGYDEYDGYAAKDDYDAELARRAAKKEASEAKKKAEAEARKRKAEAKKTIKELNEKGLDAMIHEGE